jgi:hypothetical protein
MGLSEEKHFQNYHRVLSRAVWSSIKTSRILLMMLQVKRWLPVRELVVVADSSFAALELLDAVSKRSIHMITRLRLDAALYESAPPRPPGTMGRPRLKGKRLSNLEQVLVDPNTKWEKITVKTIQNDQLKIQNYY